MSLPRRFDKPIKPPVPETALPGGSLRLRKAGVGELQERPGTMRQPPAVRRQPVLFLGRHLAEGAVVAVRLEQRVVTEAERAARRPDDGSVDRGLELLDMTVRPGDAQRRDEMAAALLRRLGAALDQQALNLVHGEPEILVRPGP